MVVAAFCDSSVSPHPFLETFFSALFFALDFLLALILRENKVKGKQRHPTHKIVYVDTANVSTQWYYQIYFVVKLC